MAKASIKLASGASVQIEGSPEEIRTLLELYSGEGPGPASRAAVVKSKTPIPREAGSQHSAPDLAKIVALIKDCKEAEEIDRQILDRTSQVDRSLLPLYIVHEHLGNSFGLSSGEINRITTDLGVPVSMPNVSTTLASTAAKYVIGDKVRVKGLAVRYKLSRKGLQYMKSVIAGASGAV